MPTVTTALIACIDSIALYNFFWIHVVSFIDITFTLLTLIVGIRFYFYVRKYKIYAHFNFRIIGISLCVFFTMYSVCILMVQLFHQYQWRFGAPCAATLKRWQCLAIRGPTLVAVIGFSFNHLLFFIDRVLATFKPLQYEQCKRIYGVCGVVSIWLVALGTSYWTFYDNDMSQVYPYCLVTSQTSGPRLILVYSCQIGFNVCVLIGDAILKKLSTHRVKVRERNISPGRYALGERIQLRENQITTAWLFPFAILHTSVFLVFLIMTSIYRMIQTNSAMTPQHITILEALHSIVCVYAFCANVINLRIYVKLYKEREATAALNKVDNHADVYFQMFSKQLGGARKIC